MKPKIILILLLPFMLLTACDKESDYQSNLAGKWSYDNAELGSDGSVHRSELLFNQDGTFKETTSVVAKSGDLLGYTSLTTGNYKVKGDQLSYSNLAQLINDGSKEPYAPIDKLIPIITVAPLTRKPVTIQFSDQGRGLKLIYVCGPAESCLADNLLPVYKRVK
ncbi:lipocalin family protein [Hufsiella ginkgonis]|uniref:Lipocalin-like domain-containing protein n=1 Tax=Hufsiella ginkgonis TaxID=2695274 RepID=A0A7K1XTY5_9SPHI|nr:lipocalin family protein [Hufsiella ginkgonis]MXV14483.1 hypothetical protein [Hufsiella ginkgonis]